MLIRAQRVHLWGAYAKDSTPPTLPENARTFVRELSGYVDVYTVREEILLNVLRCSALEPLHDGQITRALLTEYKHVVLNVAFADVCDALAHSITDLGGDL